MAKQDTTYDSIMASLRAKQYAPIYCLMGDEGYYIDEISNYIIDHVLTSNEKEFNLTIAYGADIDIATIINAAKRYPMMSEYQVVVVKEAQNVKNLEELGYYLQKPLKSTILVICYKNGSIDSRKKWLKEVSKVGVLFESKKLKDYQLPAFINGYMQAKGLEIDSKAAQMMADFVGTDLSRMTGELEKLIITQPRGQKRVTPEQVEQNIGISKDFNVFELRSAIVAKDVMKANRIIKYFAENPKTYPLQMTTALLFNFFSNLFMAYYSPDRSEAGVASFLGLKSSWAAKDYLTAMRNFSGIKVMQIIHEIRLTDARSKGVDNNSVSDADLQRELIFKMLH
ncbi:MAG: DNA polymerase III subunit delta [Bacteroidaceae bacterium]|nr:DNA polymerase III subunit delta [Bacteroidaceae bacterium]